MRIKRLATVILALLLLVAPAQARPWITSGGDQWRRSLVEEPVGLMDWAQRIELPLGQSAAQPVMIGERIYHSAGPGLYEILPDPLTGQPTQYQLLATSNRHPMTREVRVSGSTPTYSPESGWLYWGTASGELWGLNTATGKPRPHRLDIGCSIVSSPLVMRVANRDVVIVGQKPTDSCTVDGKIYAVWGWESGAEPVDTSFPTGGWATPSPVPDPFTPDGFIAGADGAPCDGQNGRIVRMRILTTPDGGYALDKGPDICTPAGAAGSFAIAYGHLFWVDTAGVLWGKSLRDGLNPFQWPADSINLPALLGGAAFTNTKPAIHAWQDSTGQVHGAIYVTLRNFVAAGQDLPLRGCPPGSPWAGHKDFTCPGAPGMLVAVDLTSGALLNKHPLPQAPQDGAYSAANTDPLVLPSREAVIFGDANGWLRGRPLEPSGGRTAAAIFTGKEADLPLLPEGRQPMRGAAAWSQVSGAGVDPAVASGSLTENDGHTWLMMGVNAMPPDQNPATAWQKGSLILIPFTRTGNLRWTDKPTETVIWKDGADVTVSGTVTLEQTTQRLDQFRQHPPGVNVTWYLVPPENRGLTDPAKLFRLGHGDEPLPGSLQQGQTATASKGFRFTEEFPDEGFVVGVIDAERVAQDAREEQLAASLLGPDPGPAVESLRQPETTLTDNFLSIPYRREVPLDLSVAISAPESLECRSDAKLASSITVTNNSRAPVQNVTARLLLRSGTAPDPRVVWRAAIPQIGPGVSLPFPAAVSPRCDDLVTLTAEVNPDRTIPEVRYDNNRAQVQTTVGPYLSTAPQLDQGEGHVTIVDESCQVNPDAESSQPCLNLDVRNPDQ